MHVTLSQTIMPSIDNWSCWVFHICKFQRLIVMWIGPNFLYALFYDWHLRIILPFNFFVCFLFTTACGNCSQYFVIKLRILIIVPHSKWMWVFFISWNICLKEGKKSSNKNLTWTAQFKKQLFCPGLLVKPFVDTIDERSNWFAEYSDPV